MSVAQKKDAMYSTDLSRISLDEFEEMLSSVDLLPGRRMLLEGLADVLRRLKHKGIGDLAALRELLKKKKAYAPLSAELSVSCEYLTILNREVNSYVAKPTPLARLDVFTADEIKRLEAQSVKTTEHLYAHSLTAKARSELSSAADVDRQRLEQALELADLLRINGVGLVYAEILREMGIRTVADYLAMDSEEILTRYQQTIARSERTAAKLGLKDIEYCKRFCKKLDCDIRR